MCHLNIEFIRAAIMRDRALGKSLGEIAKLHQISKTTVGRVLSQMETVQ